MHRSNWLAAIAASIVVAGCGTMPWDRGALSPAPAPTTAVEPAPELPDIDVSPDAAAPPSADEAAIAPVDEGAETAPAAPVDAAPVEERADAPLTPADIFGVGEDDYRRGVVGTASSADATILGPCRDRGATPARTDALAPADQVMAALAGDRGVVIRERVEVTGCGQNARTHNVVPFTTEAGELRFETFAPGESFASLKLQLDVMRDAVTAAARHFSQAGGEAACDARATAPWLIDTRVRGAPDGSGPWEEDWILFVCGQRRTLLLRFTPTGTGVSFSATVPAEG